MNPGPQSLYSDGLFPPSHHDLSVITHTLSTPSKIQTNCLLLTNFTWVTDAVNSFESSGNSYKSSWNFAMYISIKRALRKNKTESIKI